MSSSRWLPPEIQTPRLRLREPRVADASEIFRSYAQDVEVCRYLRWTPHASLATVVPFIAECIEAWQSDTRIPFVITESDSDQAVGMLDARRAGGTVDVGYVLSRRLWGNGLMPEALRALTGLALSDSRIFRVQATCDVANVASRRVLEKSDFRCEGRLERFLVLPNLSNEPRACFMFARCC